VDWFAGVTVDGKFYLLMGNPTPSWATASPLTQAQQTSLTVQSTQTLYTFTAGAVAVNLTFTTPQIAGDWDLMSRPCHYLTYSVAALDGSAHAVSLYQDVTSYLVLGNGKNDLVSFGRVPLPGVGAEALSLRVLMDAAEHGDVLRAGAEAARGGAAVGMVGSAGRATGVPGAGGLAGLVAGV
jgi:hypothetical protein